MNFLNRYIRIKEDTPNGYPFSNPLDWIVAAFTMVVGVGFFLYVKQLGIVLHLIDQYSHLSIGRQITDSLTPGISQVGFWPPLLHILLAPFTYFDALFYSGYAAAALLIPVLALGVVFFARTVYLLTGVRSISYITAVALLLNPYLLYYSVTPMMEVLFLATLFGATYFFLHWWQYQTLGSLVFAGLFVSLATMSRFEGFILLPLVGFLVLLRSFREKHSMIKIEANATIFGLIAATGLVFIVGYGLVYGGNFLSFMNNSWSAYTQQRDLELPTEHNLLMSVVYLGAAAEAVIGISMIVVVVVLLLTLLVLAGRHRGLYLVALILLGSPFIFDLMALYQGSAVIYLPSLPPYPDTFFNVRYGLLLIGFFVMVPALLGAHLFNYFYRSHSIVAYHIIPSAFVLMLLVNSMIVHAQQVVCATCFPIITQSIQVHSENRLAAANTIQSEYNGGYVLMTRALNNEIAVTSHIPLHSFIFEANEHHFDQAIARPWWYARYVVMYNPETTTHQPWMLENELISKRWANNAMFEYYYEPIFTSDTEMVYELDTERFRSDLLAQGLDPQRFPSLNPDTEWDVGETHIALEEIMKEIEERSEVAGL